MFDDLGRGGRGRDAAGRRVEQLADPGAPRTPDLGGDAGIVTVVDDLFDRI